MYTFSSSFIFFLQTTLSGPASIPPVTINDAFKRICSRFPDKPALCVKRNDKWDITTFRHYYANVTQATKSLISLGLEPHHGICILGFNSPEWLISYLAGIMVSLLVYKLCMLYSQRSVNVLPFAFLLLFSI